MCLRHGIFLACIVLAIAVCSTVEAQVGSKSNENSASPTAQASRVDAQAFDQLIGINSNGSNAALYSIGRGISIVDLASGEVTHHLPLSSPMHQAISNSAESAEEDLADLTSNIRPFLRRLKVFFTNDTRYVWILGVPGGMADAVISKKNAEEFFRNKETCLEKWDLRTSELVDNWPLASRCIVDAELVQIDAKNRFVFLERKLITPAIDGDPDRSDCVLAYDLASRDLVANRTLSGSLFEGSLENHFGALVIKTRGTFELIDPNSLQLKWESPNDRSKENRKSVRGIDSLMAVKPDFGFIDGETSYGALQSSIIDIRRINYKTGKIVREYRLPTRFEWTNMIFKNAQNSNESQTDYLQRMDRYWNARQNPPLAIGSITPDGIWLVQHEPGPLRKAKAKAYLHSFDGNISELFDIPGYVFDGYSGGFITAKGVWSTTTRSLIPYFHPSKIGDKGGNPGSQIKEVQTTQCIGVGNGELLYVVGEQLTSVDASTGKILSTWPLPDGLMRPLDQQEPSTALSQQAEAVWFEKDKSWVVALPEVAENYMNRERILKEQVEATHARNLTKMAESVREFSTEKPVFTRKLFHDAKTNLIGWDFNLIRLVAGQPTQLLMRTTNTVCLKLAATKEDVRVLEVSADPRQLRVHLLKENKLDASAIIIEQKKSFQDQSVEQLSRDLTLKHDAPFMGGMPQYYQDYESMLANRSRNYCISSTGHETIVAVADPHAVFMREVRIFKLGAGVEEVHKELSFLVNENQMGTAPGGMTLLDFADDQKSPMTLGVSPGGRFVASVIRRDQDSKGRFTALGSNSIYLDIRDLQHNKRVRFMPLGKILTKGGAVNSVEMDSEAKHIALTVSNGDKASCMIVRISSNKLLATIPGNPKRVFAEKGKIVNGMMVADLDQLAIEGESAFRALSGFAETHRN